MENKNQELVLIIKNAGTTCNIGCRYCAEARKKQVDLSNVKTVTYEDIERIMSITQDVKNLTVLFHGGEPLLLSIDYYEQIIKRWREQRDDVYFGFQTNSTLIDNKWLDFFEKYQDIVGISISLDGDETANLYRQYKNGEATFSKVIESMDKLQSRKIKIGMISTINQAAIGREYELYDIISKYDNIRFLKLNPCYDMWSDGSIPEWAILPDEYAKFVLQFFDIMYNNKYLRKINVEPYLSIIKGIKGIENSFCNFCNKKCNYFLSIYPNSKIIACDNFDLSDGYYPDLNNAQKIDDILKAPPQPLFSQLESLTEDCKNCNYFEICHGGCLAVRRRYKLYGRNNEYKLYCRAMQHMINYLRNKIESVHK